MSTHAQMVALAREGRAAIAQMQSMLSLLRKARGETPDWINILIGGLESDRELEMAIERVQELVDIIERRIGEQQDT